jgi:hypothetical protein
MPCVTVAHEAHYCSESFPGSVEDGLDDGFAGSDAPERIGEGVDVDDSVFEQIADVAGRVVSLSA